MATGGIVLLVLILCVGNDKENVRIKCTFRTTFNNHHNFGLSDVVVYPKFELFWKNNIIYTIH